MQRQGRAGLKIRAVCRTIVIDGSLPKLKVCFSPSMHRLWQLSAQTHFLNDFFSPYRNKMHNKCAAGWTVILMCKKKAVKPAINCPIMLQIKHHMMTAAGIKANHSGVNSEGLILFFHSLTSWRNYPGGCFKEDVLADMWYRFALSLVCQWSESLFNFLSNTQKLPLHRTRNVRMLKDESSTVGYYPPGCARLHTHTPDGTFIDEMPVRGNITAKNTVLSSVFLWILSVIWDLFSSEFIVTKNHDVCLSGRECILDPNINLFYSFLSWYLLNVESNLNI